MSRYSDFSALPLLMMTTILPLLHIQGSLVIYHDFLSHSKSKYSLHTTSTTFPFRLDWQGINAINSIDKITIFSDDIQLPLIHRYLFADAPTNKIYAELSA
jgi:hypothetical protein